jgi:hypothetical protein
MITMNTRYSTNPTTGAADVLASLSERVIHASVFELRCEDALTLAIRQSFKHGMDVDQISNATGLRPVEIRRRLECELFMREDVDALFG